MDARMVMTTASNSDEAKKIAEALLARKKAACVQCQNITSYYRWKGEMKNDSEVLLLIKCRKEHVVDVKETELSVAHPITFQNRLSAASRG